MFVVVFAFIAGIVTILSPCILPVLPIVLSGSVGGSRTKPLGIVLGFILSFTFFTLALSTIVKLTGVSADFLRVVSVVIVALFGLSLLFAQFQILAERLFTKLARFGPKNSANYHGFFGGIVLGVSLGLVWTPCVGPIIASVIALAAASNVNLITVLITLSYSIGTAIPMLVIIYGGQKILQKVPVLSSKSLLIQRIFGVLMIVVAIAIFFNFDRKFQTFVLSRFPNYGSGLTAIEDNSKVKNDLQKLKGLSDSGPLSQMAPEIIAGGKWFNSAPLKISDLKGKVVLVDFWTYTCINCIRTLPYIKTWDEKYRAKGLVVIGVHTPEFEFEKNADNVQKALKDFGITYPVVQDNDYSTWRAFDNNYWPAKYFIDKNGKVRSTHFGEGNYDEAEQTIQTLLAETGADVANMPIQNPVTAINAKSPESYLGYARLSNFDSNEQVVQDRPFSYSAPDNVRDNYFAYTGNWLVGSERAMPSAGAKLIFNFNAGNVYLVMRSKNNLQGKIKVFVDNKAADSSNAGDDLKDSVVTVVDDRLYNLVKLKDPGKHILRLEFMDNNLEVYAFTFG